ncbi:unnamed protein product [Prorocentrum cordatum]|uniref:Protein kinase domain-containing protein n=1 Tax=Prorocentrum cordatum TaxID=2364126 RepID=A0ABN9S8U8_9DINO|nr:unnamed protein product [Polarella glacialis]
MSRRNSEIGYRLNNKSPPLKPDNILLTRPSEDAHSKIADFGLARTILKSRDCRTFCGTPQYFAPELVDTLRNQAEGVPPGGYGKQMREPFRKGISVLWVPFARFALASAAGLNSHFVAAPGSALAFLMKFADAANLALDFGKRQIVGCGDMDLSILKSVLKDTGYPADKLTAGSGAVHLGVPIGPDGHLHVWGSVFPAFRSRVRLARAMGIGLDLSAVAGRVMCVALLQYRLQLCPVSGKLISSFKERALLLTVGPRYAISYELATQLHGTGLGVEFLDLFATAKAACARLALRSKAADTSLALLQSDRDDLEHAPHRWHRGWNASSLLANTCNALSLRRSISPNIDVQGEALQTKIHRLARKRDDFEKAKAIAASQEFEC